jgi:hypothetical protein
MPTLESETVVNATCPWSGKPVRSDSLTRYRGRLVGFCNPGCRDRFEAAVMAFETAIGPDEAAGAGKGAENAVRC